MFHRWLSACCSLALCFSLVSAIEIQGKIKWNAFCTNLTALGRAQATLDGGRFSASVTQSGHFTLFDVPEGTYILSVVSHDFVFDQLRIDVAAGSERPEVRPYIPGTPLNPPSTVLLPYPITLSAKERFSYFSPPQSFNIMSMLSNPMMMMMVIGGGMVLILPNLIKNMDPEALSELKQSQAQLAGVQNAFASGDIKGGLNAIMAASEAGPVEEKAAPAKNPRTGGGGKKRR